MKNAQDVFIDSYEIGREKAVTFEELRKSGWSIFEFTEYCSLCEQVRANAILNNAEGVLTAIEKVRKFLKGKACVTEDVCEVVVNFIIFYWTSYFDFSKANVLVVKSHTSAGP